jgi:type IV pilus assembly protein PilC
MPRYNYTAVNINGRETKGTIDAANKKAIASLLKGKNLFLVSASKATTKRASAKAQKIKHAKKSKRKWTEINIGTPVIKTKDLTIFTRQLSILIEAGLPLIRSLRTLENQSKNPILKKILLQVAESIEGGATFSDALARHPKSFDKLYLSMIRAGEAAGVMGLVLDRLAMFMEKASRISGKVKSAMIYPTVIMGVMTIVVTALMAFVVPNFKKIFTDLLAGEPLPMLTTSVIKVSDILKDQSYIVVIGLFIIIVVTKLLLKTTRGKYVFDWLLYNAPFIGPIVSKTAISRFSRTLGTLLSSGVAVLGALKIVKETSGSEVVSSAIQKVHDAVKDGETIAAPLKAARIFPQMVISMLEVGEETGKLPDMCNKIADTYEEEVDNAVGALTSIIEPLMIVVMAVLVGTIVIALFMPLTKILDKLAG